MSWRVAACLVLLAAVAVAPAAAARLAVGGNPFHICETYNKNTCLVHADRCTVCLAWGKWDTCFLTTIAQKLPPRLFACDFPPPPAPKPEPEPSPDKDCGSLLDEDSCTEAHCVWCVSAAVPSSCYTEAEAKRLPPAVFKCDLPSLTQQ